jgi:asparagine synthase (glutamine-hydrolysing)
MCGISGQLKLDATPVDRGLVRRMTRALAHRGPDDERFHFEGVVGLGHRRLSIIDAAGGAQPMTLPGPRTLRLVSNSEIYNYVELRSELVALGHQFVSRSDTEVILRLFAAEGEAGFLRLEGMFAIAIWDEAAQTLYLARDRFGVKPLYYCHDHSAFLFASELKALLQYRGLDRTLDRIAIDSYFGSLALPEPRTVFRNVHKLPPGHLLTVRQGRVKQSRYWNPASEMVRKRPVARPAEELLEEIERSVRISLRSDVPVGVLLSGGLDSSTVTAMAARASGTRLHTFSAAFREGDFDEGHWARLVAKRFGTRHHEVLVTKSKATAIAQELVEHFDEPFADSSSIPMYAVCRAASQVVKTALSGEGADELFGGYPWHGSGPLDDHPARMIFTREERDELYARRWRRPARRLPPEHGLSRLKRSLLEDLRTYLPSDILQKSDRVSMMHSLELRVPFLNHRLAGFALRLPDQLKVRGEVRKFLLRQVMKGMLPREVISRPKKGFSIPMDLWLWEKGPWRDMVYDTVFSGSLRRRGLFDLAVLRRMQREHDRLERLHGYRFWTLFMFENWQQRWGG